jgi:hypothetical protein
MKTINYSIDLTAKTVSSTSPEPNTWEAPEWAAQEVNLSAQKSLVMTTPE